METFQISIADSYQIFFGLYMAVMFLGRTVILLRWDQKVLALISSVGQVVGFLYYLNLPKDDTALGALYGGGILILLCAFMLVLTAIFPNKYALVLETFIVGSVDWVISIFMAWSIAVPLFALPACLYVLWYVVAKQVVTPKKPVEQPPASKV